MKNIVNLLMKDNIKDISLIESIIFNYSSINEFDESILKHLNLNINVVELVTLLHNLEDLSLTKSFDYFKHEIINNPSKYITYSDFHSQEIYALKMIEKNSTIDEFLTLLNNLKGSKGFELYLRHEYVISYYDESKDIDKYFPKIKEDYIDFILNEINSSNEYCSFNSLGRALKELIRLKEFDLAIKLFNNNLMNCVEHFCKNEKFNLYKYSNFVNFKNHLYRFHTELNYLSNIMKDYCSIKQDELTKFVKDYAMKNNIPKNEDEIMIFTKEFGNKYAMLQ